MTEILIIIALIILNGVFAMSEAAVIATRKARLQQEADSGSRRARAALKLADDPTRFLSTVQIGITLIGILAGVFGGATVARTIELELTKIPFLAPYAGTLSYGLVVLLTTYLSLIIGELVPKRLALRSPEKIAKLVAIPMQTLSRLASPLVSILSFSSDAVLWVFGVRPDDAPPVTEEEIKAMMQQGVDAGVFEEAEHEMVAGVFTLGELRVKSLMTPRTEVEWLNLEDTDEENIRKILDSNSSRFPVCEGDIDNVVGVVHARDLFARSMQGQPFDLRAVMAEPLFVPETIFASRLMEVFKEKMQQMAIVIGEHGGVEGVVTIQDLLDEIVGEVTTDETSGAVQRDDGSWLLDGMMPVGEFKTLLLIDDELPGEYDEYETLAGFVMTQLGRIPAAADQFIWDRFRFEVIDMDGNRIDKVLVEVLAPPPMLELEREDETEPAE